jgi:hypothetical protein
MKRSGAAFKKQKNTIRTEGRWFGVLGKRGNCLLSVKNSKSHCCFCHLNGFMIRTPRMTCPWFKSSVHRISQ